MRYPTVASSGMNSVLSRLKAELRKAQSSGNTGLIGQLQARIGQLQQAMSSGTSGSTTLGGQEVHYPLYDGSGQMTPQAISMLTAKDYQSAYDEAKAANESRYGEMMGGYQERYDRGMGMLSDYGQQMGADIDEGFFNQAQATKQDLSRRGLSNTTIAGGAAIQNERERSKEQRRLGEDLTRLRTTQDAQLSGDLLAAMERRTDEYPDFNQMMALSQALGASGGSGGFGYGGGGGAALDGLLGGYTSNPGGAKKVTGRRNNNVVIQDQGKTPAELEAWAYGSELEGPGLAAGTRYPSQILQQMTTPGMHYKVKPGTGLAGNMTWLSGYQMPRAMTTGVRMPGGGRPGAGFSGFNKRRQPAQGSGNWLQKLAGYLTGGY